MTPDFGGVNIKALNPGKKAIGVILIAFDNSTQALEVQDQHYTNVDTINYSVRGYAATPRKLPRELSMRRLSVMVHSRVS